MGISVIICCYNSVPRLDETLKHLANQKVPDDLQWEVILVDNNSSDNTKGVAQEVWSKYQSSASFRIISESTPGVGWARKKGVMEARYDYILFCDDDNWLVDTYVADGYRFITSDPALAAVGGRGEPVFEVDEPHWFKDVSASYALGPQRAPGTLYSAGLVVNRKILLNLYDIGFESLLVGRTGTSLTSGEDFEYVYLFQILGYKVDYQPSLVFKHFISKDKLTLNYVNKLYKGFGEAYPILACYNFIFSNSDLPPQKQWFKLFWRQVVTTPLIFLFGKSRPRKAHLMMNVASILSFMKLKNRYRQGYDAILDWKKKYSEIYKEEAALNTAN